MILSVVIDATYNLNQNSGGIRKRGNVSPSGDEAAFFRAVSLSSEDQRFSSTELPIIDFEELVASTDNFSQENKLGQGGFGHVYKVTTLI